MAAILDPRCKIAFVEWCLGTLFDGTNVSDMINSVKQLLFKLFDSYKTFGSHGEGESSDSNLGGGDMKEVQKKKTLTMLCSNSIKHKKEELMSRNMRFRCICQLRQRSPTMQTLKS